MGFFDKVKEVAEKVGDTVESGVKNASDGAKKLNETRKIKKEIEQTEKAVTNLFTEVGMKLFEANPASAEFAAQFAKVSELKEKIAQLNKELNDLEEKYPCPNCGETVEKGQKFCDKCGASVEAVTTSAQSAEEEAKKSCANCGAAAEEGQKFCEKCGAKLEEAVEEVKAEVVE